MKSETYEEKYQRMTQTPVNRLIVKLAIPAVFSNLVTSVYNTADTYFVSQINTSATAAVGVIFSVMTMIQAIGYTLGAGGGNYISRMLGKKDREEAKRASAVSFYVGIFLGLLLSIFGLLNLSSLVRLLGATETIAPYAEDYCKFILIAAPYMVATFVLNSHLSSQGYAFLSMFGTMTGGILNLILDPIFIFVLDLGISGAAIATILSQFISFSILLIITLTTKGVLKPSIRYFTFNPRVLGQVVYAGLPSLGRQGFNSLSTVVVNLVAAQYGDAAIAALSIVTKITSFIYSAFLGFGQGFQPVCGYNFGAKRYDRVLEAYHFTVRVATVLLSILGVIFFILAEPLITAFRDDPAVIEIGVNALRFQCLTQFFQGTIIVGNMLTQSIGYGFRATFTAICRHGLCYIPALYIMPALFGITGLELAQSTADLMALIVVVIVTHFVIKELKQKAKEQKAIPINENPPV